MGARSWLFLSMLLIGAGFLTRFYHSRQFNSNLSSTIQQNIVREFQAIDLEARNLMEDGLSVTSTEWDEARHFFVLIDHDQVVAWNRTYFVPDLTSIPMDDTLSFVSSSRGDFLVRKWKVSGDAALFCVLKLTDRFPIINNFLSSQWEPSIFPIRDIRILDPGIDAGEAIKVVDKVIFRIELPRSDPHESTLSLLLLLGGVLTLLLALWKLADWMGRSYNCDSAVLVLVLGLLGIRLGMIAISLPALYWPNDMFDPKVFASSSLNASMGDLWLNAAALMVPIGYLFVHFSKFRFVRWALQLGGIQRFAVGTVCLLSCFFALLFPFDFIEAIYHNSTLSLDSIQSLSYDVVRIGALAAVLFGCVCSFLFLHVFFSLANRLYRNRTPKFVLGLVIAAALFTLQFLFISERWLWMNLALAVFFFAALKLFGINMGTFRISFQLFIYLIFSLSIFSLQNAWAVRTFFLERQVKDQFRFGKDFLTERDVLGEYLLDQARQRIQADQFIQTRMSSLFLRKTSVADKIRRVHLNNYFDRYEISVRTRSAVQIENRTEKDETDSLSASQGLFLPTDYPGISYINASEGAAVKRYHVTIPIYYQRPVGWVELDLALKRVIPENVYPELLVDNRFNQIYRNRDFSYAVYTKGVLVNSFGSFNYERDFGKGWLEDPDLFVAGLADNRYYHIGIEATDGSVALVSAAGYSWFYFITNFSFWFVLGLVLLFAGQGFMGLRSYMKGVPFNYSARIQLFVFFAFLLPVIAVSITTLTLIGRSNEEAIKKDFLDRSNTISRRIVGIISADSVRAGQETSLETWIEENATSSKTDISVYSPEGRMLATSQPALFEDKLVSRQMDRDAWKRIALQGESQTVTNEELGKLKYSCAYAAVLSPESGELVAIVGLPFFESATYLQKSQSLIFSNILIVFVVAFLLFSLLSFWASSSLTFPIRFITKTLGQTTLNGQNKPLQWNSSDEIGMLVREYNRMVENLEESKRALAQSEKETAWREMAKQVAHEIKNPLTPMKLTLQQLEVALNSGALSVEKSQKSLDVLLHQVEILNKIAVSFSTFANMPASSPQVVDMANLLRGVVGLFGATTEGKVTLEIMDGPALVSVDPASFSRAISNIVINALQAGREGQKDLAIGILMSTSGGRVNIAINDNGRGMAQDVQERLFQPHFTTKQSGSGLGLAMTKQIVLQAGGKIWFESAPNSGTRFNLELPVVAG